MMDDKDREPGYEEGGSDGVIGAAAGSTGGALIGTAMGLLVGGPLGMLAGGVGGTLVGAGVGYWVDYNPHEDEFRRHHEADPARARHPFEQASPAYRYGWESRQRPEFRDKTYAQARQELHKGWTGSGDFADYEGYVEHAWDRVAASHEAGSFSQAAKE